MIIKVIGVIAVVGLLLGGYAVTHQTQSTTTYVDDNGNQQVGSVTGPDFFFDQETHNGLRTAMVRKPLTLATTTPCTVKSPNATSTLLDTTVVVTTSTSTATTWIVAKATVPNATTTIVAPGAIFSLGSAAQGGMVFVASSTAVLVDAANVFAPNTYLNWGVQGTAISDTTKLNGYCAAVFQVL